ncbi:hypothetical protein T4A_13879 [Trichinella pseudospiralis]|uniref:Uncharacterized protein n=1 Tax=Trichinella pseudospiralis TaxID=6337 RepID=A0A0V1E023_TRIPS|nr:hypothetical protein T4A_13879 [Trichinella pseudospiralis]
MCSKAVCLLIVFFALFPNSNSGFVLELYKAKNGTGNLNYVAVNKSAFGFFISIVIIGVALLNLVVLLYFLRTTLFKYCKKFYQHLFKSSPQDEEEKLLEFVDETFLI